MLFMGIIAIIPTNTIRLILLKLSGMKIGKAHLYNRFHIRQPNKIIVGDGTVIGHKVTLDGRFGLEIGKSVNISSEAMIWTMQHDYNDPKFGIKGGRVVIEDYAWISTRAIILPNIKIGKGSVVAAGSVVTKNIEPFTVVAGNPAKVIAQRNSNLDYDLRRMGTISII